MKKTLLTLVALSALAIADSTQYKEISVLLKDKKPNTKISFKNFKVTKVRGLKDGSPLFIFDDGISKLCIHRDKTIRQNKKKVTPNDIQKINFMIALVKTWKLKEGK